MRFSFTEDQNLFRDAVRDVLAGECPPTTIRGTWERKDGVAPKAYATLAEAGFVGCTASEDAGGMGMNPLDTCLPFEEVGYAGLPGPVVETTAIAIPLLEALDRTDGGAARLASLVSGEAVATYGRAGDAFVPHGSVADFVVFVSGDELHVLPKGSFGLTPQVSVDRARDVAVVTPTLSSSTLVAKGPEVLAAVAAAELRGAVATAAVLVGLARRMLDLTVEYAKVRHQFGKPIGSFQAVKHKLADSLIKIEFARPMVYRAAYALATGDADAPLQVSMGKIFASECAPFVAKHALQVHGAIGYTIECDLHFFMKRAWALSAQFGDTHTHRRKVADAVLGPVQGA